MTPESAALWKDRLMRARIVPFFERAEAHVERRTPGDRAILYGLGILIAVASVVGLYSLQRNLLVEVPTYGGRLVEGEVGNPRFVNPLLAISDVDRDISHLVYAGLMGFSGDGSLTPVLAESYEVSEDGKTYTFILREDAEFTNGTPVTAADVVYTVTKAQDPGLKSPVYANWAGVRAEAVDARTVRFTLQKPYVPFLGVTTLGILPSRLWQNISDEEFPFSILQTNPVGAGPFKVTKVSRDASGLVKSMELSANDSYAPGRPYLDSIRFNFYARAEDLRAALAKGDVESAYDVSADGALTAPYARVFGVFWNPNEKQVLVRAEVRKALSLALNRERIVTEVLGGYATPIMGPVPPGGSVEQVTTPSNESVTTQAAQVLRAAGWSYDGDARAWKHAGAKLVFDSLTIRTSAVPELKNVATAAKQDWEALGLGVTIELYEPGDLSQNVIRPRKYEGLLYGMVIGRDQDLYAFWHSKERNDPGLNIALYANKTIDDLLEEARTTPDARARTAALQKIEDLVAADYPAAFIYAPDFTYAVPKDLLGVELPQITTPTDRFATVASWYRKTDAVWPFFASDKR